MSSRRRAPVAFAAALAVLAVLGGAAGCSSEDGGGTGTASPCVGEGCTPAPCLDPTDPSCGEAAGFTQCPAGFRARDGEPGCDPVVAATCEPGTLRALGGGCEPVGPSCAAGFASTEWGCAPVLPSGACAGATRAALGSTTCAAVGTCASGPPADADTFVDPAFTAGQLDARHVKTIAEALAVPGAAVVAIAPGTYAERIVVPRSGMKIVGRCAASVVVDGSALPTPQDGVLVDGKVDVDISGMTIRENLVGVRVKAGGKATVRDVVIEKSVIGGVQAEGTGSRLEVRTSLVRDGYPGSILAGRGGVGATAATGATLAMIDATIQSAVGIGANADPGGTVDLTRVVVRDTKMDSEQAYGMGAFARNGTLSAKDLAISGGYEIGLGCMGASTCSIEGGTISDVKPSTGAGRGFGRGVQALDGDLRASDLTVARAAQAGLWAEGKGKIDVTSSVLRECGGRGDDAEQNSAAMAVEAGQLTLSRSAVVQSWSGGLRSVGKGSAITATNVLVEGVRANSKDSLGHGIDVQEGAKATLSAVTVSRSVEVALLVDGKGSAVVVDGAILEKTAPNAAKSYGFGVAVTAGATLDAARAAVLDNLTMGVVVTDDGSAATFRGLHVARTGPLPANQTFGRGLQVQLGGRVDVDGATLVENVEAAAAVVHPGSALELTHALLARTQPGPTGAGRAFVAQAGGRGALVSSVSLDATQIGISVADIGSDLSVDRCIVARTTKDASEALGHGIIALGGATARVLSTTVQESAGAALAFDAVSAVVRSCRVERNAIGLFATDGTPVTESSAPPDEPQADRVIVSRDTKFTENQVRVSGGVLPLPEPLEENAGKPKR